MRIHVIYGQFGPVFSLGFRSFGASLATTSAATTTVRRVVDFWEPTRPDLLVADIRARAANNRLKNLVREREVVLGYSLGGNSASWVADGLGTEIIDLVVAYDPTIRSYLTPLRKNVLRAISYHQTGYWGTSLFFGRGILTSSAFDGPRIEEYQFVKEHLMVQSDTFLHDITRKAIEAVK
jgi:hypothetical protein